MRVLVVEDDTDVSALLRSALTRQGWAVDVAGTGDEGLWMAREHAYDAVVLDGQLPDRDGFSVCRQLRDEGRWMPVLMLTGRQSVDDRVAGLDAGADDYLTKPFALPELQARLRAVTRREAKERPTVLTVGDLVLDPGSREVRRGDAGIELTAKEFALLREFMANAGQVLSRQELIERVWDFAYDGDSNVVDVYVRYLREKVDRPFGRQDLQTVRGAGYRLVPSEPAAGGGTGAP
ncbi:two-component system OmpR family response regulator [Motilibacter rhizosphaerae]|uniref:Two-component system OmpR family response regulator n=1 Tax=Motilibacter rhizosphaerae TaxID=598652 RepID=A0A4Q7NV07_9ACTN|nr:response regulator transcription factor [Motilibacter rhizosphaerae]RZS91017.1 two-component system OmpR family response regulator [Motilibacter rhizosphaerae]